jgi:hypothetical protein
VEGPVAPFRPAACQHGEGSLANPVTRTGRPLAVAAPQHSAEQNRGEQLLLPLIFFECLICLLIWWRGVAIALGDQPEHRNWDMAQRRRRSDWVRNELQERPWWWLMLSGLVMLVLVDWIMDKWEQRPWRAAILWTILMLIVLVVVVVLTEHLGWSIGG